MGNIPLSVFEQRQNQEQPQPPEPENLICEICIEPMSLSSTLFNNGGKCSHPFCTDCIIHYIQAKIEDEIAETPCPSLNCTQFLDPLECRGLVGPELFIRWCDLLCLKALLGFSWSYCPNRNCSSLIVDECGGTNVKRAVCPECKYPFCFQCKVPWQTHTGFGCEEIGDENDRAFRQLAVEKNWKRCPRCNLFVESYGPCRSVKCRCRTRFCIDCGQEIGNCRCMLAVAIDDPHFISFKGFICLVVFINMFIGFIYGLLTLLYGLN